MRLQTGVRVLRAMWLLRGIVVCLACLAPAMVHAADRDGMLATRIARSLRANGQLRGCDLSISVSNGAAQLEGRVKNSQQAKIALSVARGVEGVQDVIDRLKIDRQKVPQRAPSLTQKSTAFPVKQAVFQVQSEPSGASSAPQEAAPVSAMSYRGRPYPASAVEIPTHGPVNYSLGPASHRWHGPPAPCRGPHAAGHRGCGIPPHRVLHKLQWWPACPTCPISHLTHVGSSWGYYPTCWRQWPPCAPTCPPPMPPEAYLPAGIEGPRAADDGSMPPEMLPEPETPAPADMPLDPKKGPSKR